MPYPFALAPAPLPSVQDLLGGFVPAPTGAQTPGSMMPAPPEPTMPMPSWGQRLRAQVAGVVTPFGVPPGLEPRVMGMGEVPSLSGHDQMPVVLESADLGGWLRSAIEGDPQGAEVGRMLGLGPAFRAIGAGLSSAPVQWLGRQLPRMGAIGAPIAGAGLLTAGTGEAQAPTKAPQTRETTAQSVLDAARKALTDLDGERRTLRQRAERFDPDNFDWTNEQRIKEAQEAVGARVDGKKGPKTRAAVTEYRRRLQEQIKALDTRETTLRRDVEKADAGVITARAEDLREQGSKRLQEAEPGWLEQYAPWAGVPLGLASGYYLRKGLGSHTRRQVAGRADEAEGIAQQFGQGDVPTRVGRLNQWWTSGSPQTAPPFGFRPGGTPYPWASQTHEIRPGLMGGSVQRDVLAPDQLFRPSLGTRMSPTTTTTGLGATEAGIGHAGTSYFEPLLADAEAAVSREPTEANIQRLQRLRAWATAFGFSERLGLGTISGGLYGAAKNPMRGLPRPNVMAGETERGALDLLMHPRPPVAPPVPPTPPPVPPPAPLALGHHSAFQPRRGGQFAGPPSYPPGHPRRK